MSVKNVVYLLLNFQFVVRPALWDDDFYRKNISFLVMDLHFLSVMPYGLMI